MCTEYNDVHALYVNDEDVECYPDDGYPENDVDYKFQCKQLRKQDKTIELDFYKREYRLKYERPEDYDPQYYIDLYHYPKNFTYYCNKYQLPFDHEHEYCYYCPSEPRGVEQIWNLSECLISSLVFGKCISKGEIDVLNKKSGFAYDGKKNNAVHIEGKKKTKELQEINDWISDLIMYSPRFKHLLSKKDLGDDYYNDEDVSGCSLCKLLYGKHTFETKPNVDVKVADDNTYMCENCPCMLRCRNHNIVKRYAV